MELKEGCEKYAEKFIIEAYNNGGKISNKDFDFVIQDKYRTGVNILLKFYGTFAEAYDYQVYILSKEGMEFARKGAFSGMIENERKEKKRNKQTHYIAIVGLSISIILAIIEIITNYFL